MNCLALDIGSSTIKGAVLDLEQGAVGSIVREPFPDPISGLAANHFEVDPELVAASTRRVIERLAEAAPNATTVFACGQMGGVVLVDPESGRPLTNYLSWRDQRTLTPHPYGGSYLDEILRRWSGSELSDLGNELKPGSASSLLFWLAESQRLPLPTIPSTIGDFVLGRLCRATPRMEPTQAIGLVNLRDGRWHLSAFARLGIDRLLWPELTGVEKPLGQIEIGSRRLTCYPVLGDQQCALRGAGLRDGELSLNISTGAQVSRITSELELGAYQTRPYFSGRFLNTITHLPAGRSLSVLVNLLTELAKAEGHTLTDPWGTIARAALHADGAGLECELTFFAGPLGSTGSIRNITVENLTVGNLFHAAFANMAENFSRCADRLSPTRDWNNVVLSGGLTQSAPILRQLIERRFSAPIRESAETEETLIGLLDIARCTLRS